jgi:hypothetical protein
MEMWLLPATDDANGSILYLRPEHPWRLIGRTDGSAVDG